VQTVVLDQAAHCLVLGNEVGVAMPGVVSLVRQERAVDGIRGEFVGGNGNLGDARARLPEGFVDLST